MSELRQSLIGLEFDWLAVDGIGHLAVFSTAGWGPVPVSVLSHVDEEKQFLDPTRPPAEVAMRGFYVYDWKHWNGPYVRVAKPKVPSLAVDAEPEFRRLANVSRFHNVDFSRDKRVLVQEHIACEE